MPSLEYRIKRVIYQMNETRQLGVLGILTICLIIAGWLMRPERVNIHISGEPEPYNTYAVDLLFLSGGVNKDPEKSFYYPSLLGKFKNLFMEHRFLYTPLPQRKFADVLYRSAMCNKDREDAVGIVRKAVEDAGFIFKATSYCQGTGYTPDKFHEGRGQWYQCDFDCTQAKIVFSFERFTPGLTYLSEKLFMPLEYGAIPAYRGNGHSILDQLKVNRKTFIDRADFASDEDFAKGIVDLLRNPKRMEQMQREKVFLDPEAVYFKVAFWDSPLKIGPKGVSDVIDHIKRTPKLNVLRNRFVLTYYNKYVTNTRPTMLKVLFNAYMVIELDKRYRDYVDIEIDKCCP